MINRLKPKSEFSRNVLTLMTGTTIAQAIPIAISPILTRIYTPEDFGVLSLFVAITSIFGSISNGRYELAIMLPKKDEDAINIFALGFIITTILSFFLLFVVVLFQDHIVKLLNNEKIGVWLYFIPITVFFAGLWNILNYFNNRKKQYKDLAKATIVKSIITAIAQLSIGFFKSGAIGLISGNILSQFFANTKLFLNIFKNKILLSKISKVKIIALAKRYKKFPIYDIWSILFNTLSSQSPIVLLSMFFGNNIVGFYSLANRILTLPMSFIGGSISQIYLQQSSSIKNKQTDIKNLTLNTFIKLFYIAIIPMTLIGIYGDCIFKFIFGNQWIEAGKLAQILSMWLFLVFITSPLSTLLIIKEKQRESFIFNISIFFFRTLALFIGYYLYKSIYITVGLFTFVGIVFWIGLLLYIFNLVDIKLKEISRPLFYGIIYVFLMLIVRFFVEGKL